MKKLFHLTKAGIKELDAELGELKKQRLTIAEKIKIARDFGDLSENAEYASAREEQGRIEGRISEIEHILNNVTIIREKSNSGKVTLGSTVELRDKKGKTKQFTVVGTVEADPLEGKISDESPIGKALIGRKIGEEVTLATPSSKLVYSVVNIS